MSMKGVSPKMRIQAAMAGAALAAEPSTFIYSGAKCELCMPVYLENSNFELPELKILIDAVESSKFITEKKSRLLVEKILKLTSETSAAKLKRNLHTSGRVRSANEKGYYIVDAINWAINA